MSYGKLLGLVIGLILVIMFVVGCGGVPAATPVAEAPATTSTPNPPTVLPPTATFTSVPPTVTPTPPSPTPQPTPSPQLTKHAFLTYNNLNSVWGSSEHDIFAVGQGGTILHYDGNAWSAMSSGTSNYLFVIWGSSDHDIFAVGDNGTILHYDGSAWSSMSSGTINYLGSVWGSSGRDVFAVGGNGTILHYDGRAWSPMSSGISSGFESVWGSSAGDVFAVGGAGKILHYDGRVWSPMSSGTTYQLWGVWGNSGHNVFAFGDKGTILHYDGSAWSPMNSGTNTVLINGWGSSDSDIFISGEQGTILHYDGRVWSSMDSGTISEIVTVWGSSGSDVFAVGHYGTILHYDGRVWSDMSSGTLTAAPVSAAPAATATPRPAKPTPQPTGELIHEKITSQALASNLVDDPAERGYFVYLPPGYADGNKRYPVVYILHGATGTEYDFIFMKDDYEDMLEKGAVQEIILVFPNGNNKFKGSNYISSSTIGDYETYIAHELVAQIDANYRTIPHRDSRGITGCSMGGDGSMHLALTFPDVYNIVAPMSATYDFANDPTIPEAAAYFTHIPQDFNDFNRYWYAGNGITAAYISLAAGAAPNPDKPPFYLDMPFEVVDGHGRIVPEVWEKIAAVDVVHDLEDYLQQSTRLDHILLYHGALDDLAPVELARSFDQLLTTQGVEHEYVEVERGSHCSYDMKPVLQYLSDHLVAEQSSISESPTVTLDSALVAKIETAITQTMKVNQLPGLAIGIIKDGQVVYSNGFGLAEVDTDRVITPQSVFQLGSVSKMMVGIAIMQLKEQGKIDLDALVTTYLPYFRLADERYKEITIRQLLSHQSGLPCAINPSDCDHSYVSEYQSPEYDEGSLERHVRNSAEVKLLNAPGEQMEYSDLGFEILADVIAKVSGQSFEAYTQEHIFAPLGMKHTSFMVQDIAPELLTAPHDRQGSKIIVNSFFPYSRPHAPSSHLFSNVEDMSRYALAQLNQGQLGEMRILPVTAYEEMWTPQVDTNLPSPWERKVGLGWFLGGQEGHRLVGHGGADWGFGCGFIMALDDGLAVVVMVNNWYMAENFSYQVMEWLLETEG